MPQTFSKTMVSLFQSRVKDGFYISPWRRIRIEYSSDPKRIAEYAQSRFTRSRLVMTMISEFHLSRDSMVVSDDDHVKWLKPLFLAHLPPDTAMPQMVREVLKAALPAPSPDAGEVKLNISNELIREVYRAMIDKVLNVDLPQAIDEYISQTEFKHATRPMVLEGLMYSLGLHRYFMRPLLYVLELMFFRRTRYMERVAGKLERLLATQAVPREGSWMATLKQLQNEGKLSAAQVRGEVTSMLVASFSLSSALGSALLCLAARPRYHRKINEDPDFAKYFAMEVLRLYPPFRQFGYELITADQGGKCPVTAAGEFVISTFALHRKADYWHQPHKFFPERFQDPNAAKGFRYLPFGMGKRLCPGRWFSQSMLIEAVKYICSDESHLVLSRRDHLPIGRKGCLVSFAIDDSLTYRAKSASVL